MAQRNLRAAADAVARHPRPRRARSASTTRRRRRGATPPRDMIIPYDDALGVHPQSEGFTEPPALGLRRDTGRDQYPLLLHYPYFDLYRKQVVKQADLVLAMHVCGDAFTDEEKARNFDYYEPLTVRDSSLSACTQAVVAAEVGHLELAYDYFAEAALIDLARPRAQHPRRRPHRLARRRVDRRRRRASAACATTTACSRSRRACPRGSSGSRFRLRFRGRLVRVVVTRDAATYGVQSGNDLELRHHGSAIVVKTGEPVTEPIPPSPVRPTPTQPAGREPTRRRNPR